MSHYTRFFFFEGIPKSQGVEQDPLSNLKIELIRHFEFCEKDARKKHIVFTELVKNNLLNTIEIL